MNLVKSQKQKVVEQYMRHETDTGSPEVQIALLTTRINQLADHFKVHRKDRHSHRGLLKMINQRRKMLSYLKRVDTERYQSLIQSLGLRK